MTDVVHHLSFIHQGDPLLLASPWPAFIAGAETSSVEKQAWVINRFRELWDAGPWGLYRGGLEVLEDIWERRRRMRTADSLPSDVRDVKDVEGHWLKDLRAMGADWLII